MANFSDTVILSTLTHPLFGARFATISLFIRRVIAKFLLKFLNFRYCGNKDRSKKKFKDMLKSIVIVNP